MYLDTTHTTCNILNLRLHTLHAANMYSLVLVQRNKLLLISSFEKVLKCEYHYIMDSCRNLHREMPLHGHATTTHTNTPPICKHSLGANKDSQGRNMPQNICLQYLSTDTAVHTAFNLHILYIVMQNICTYVRAYHDTYHNTH